MPRRGQAVMVSGKGTEPMFSRDQMTRWARTRGIDTSLYDSEIEWDCLDALMQLHFAQVHESVIHSGA